MKKKLLIIANPNSGASKKDNIESLVRKQIDHSQFEVDYQFTQYRKHATELAQKAVEERYDIVASLGGDGTANEVAKAIQGSSTTFAVLPSGSGNGFAMHNGLGRDPIKAVQFINEGKTKMVDTCMVNDRFFINVSGIGYDARVAYMTKLNTKRGFWPYFITSFKEIKNFKAIPAKIESDEVNIEGKFVGIIVANASMYGYNFTVAPTAALDDGLLDVILLKEAHPLLYLKESYRFLNKTLDKSPFVVSFKTSKLTVTVAEDDYYHVDGEGSILKAGTHTFSIVRQNIRVIVNPKNQ